MKRTRATTVIILLLLSGLVLWRVMPGRHVSAAPQAANYPLNPADNTNFPTLGNSPFGTTGTYTIDASRNLSKPRLSGPGISTFIEGVFFNSTGGEIAVFTFNSLNIPVGVTVVGVTNANSRPIALLSKSDITIAGSVDVSAEGINAGPGGGGGGGAGGGVGNPGGLQPTNGAPGGVGFVNGQNGGNPSGGTPGAGGDGGAVAPNGNGKGGAPTRSGGSGAFGGAGLFGAVAGAPYGDLTTQLQGGSGGGGAGGVDYQSCSGRGGGGAIEIGAVSTLTISGAVSANGAGFCCGCNPGAGAGAGGGVVIHGATLSLTCSSRVSAQGGARGSGSTPGGGGRVHLAANTINSALALSSIINVAGVVGGNAGVLTNTVAPTIAGTATRLIFGQQPTGATPNTALNPAVTVRLEDDCGTLVTTATNTVSLSLNNANGATLGGASVNAVNGIATFGNLTVSKSGTGYTLTANSPGLTATTSNAFNINALPTITPLAVTRSAGIPASNATSANIANVSDAESGPAGVTVTVTGANPSNGVTISDIVNTNGVITAKVATACNAGNASFTLFAADGGGAITTATFNVTITPNSPPTLAAWPASTTVSFGAATTTITPNMPPTDNGVINSLTVSAPGLNTAPTVNLVTGVVTITNATPAGSFTITVTATDNCGAPAPRSFTLVVNCPTFVEVLPKPTGPLPSAAFALPAARVGQFYTTTISATPAGGSYTFSLIPSPNQLPAGLTLSSSTGVISGTTAALGSYVFRIQATPAGGCAGATRLYSLRVNP